MLPINTSREQDKLYTGNVFHSVLMSRRTTDSQYVRKQKDKPLLTAFIDYSQKWGSDALMQDFPTGHRTWAETAIQLGLAASVIYAGWAVAAAGSGAGSASSIAAQDAASANAVSGAVAANGSGAALTTGSGAALTTGSGAALTTATPSLGAGIVSSAETAGGAALTADAGHAVTDALTPNKPAIAPPVVSASPAFDYTRLIVPTVGVLLLLFR